MSKYEKTLNKTGEESDRLESTSILNGGRVPAHYLFDFPSVKFLKKLEQWHFIRKLKKTWWKKNKSLYSI